MIHERHCMPHLMSFHATAGHVHGVDGGESGQSYLSSPGPCRVQKSFR